MAAAPPEPAFAALFGAQRAELPGAAIPWVSALREAGIDRFSELGLPGPGVEAWKYTNLRPLERIGFVPAGRRSVTPGALPKLLPLGAEAHRLVFIDGLFRADLSALGRLPEGVELGSLAAALARDPEMIEGHLGRIGAMDGHSMLALNTALMRDGFLLRVPRGVVVDLPIEVIYLGSYSDSGPEGAAPWAFHPRNLIHLESGGRATVVEYHGGLGNGLGGAYLANSGTEILLEEGAALHHAKVQAEGPEATHISITQGALARDAVYDAFTLSTGARLSRNEVAIRLEGPGAACRLNGAYMLRDQQHCDNTTTIEHLAPHTSCREMFKGVIDDRARAVFQGRIVVHPKAQKSDGHQLCKALLLSDRAEIDAKPELEIYADDVKCSHGAAVGDLDREALFYLRARGIPETAARNMLIEAFLAEPVQEIAADGLRPALMASIGHWLSSASRGAVQ